MWYNPRTSILMYISIILCIRMLNCTKSLEHNSLFSDMHEITQNLFKNILLLYESWTRHGDAVDFIYICDGILPPDLPSFENEHNNIVAVQQARFLKSYKDGLCVSFHETSLILFWIFRVVSDISAKSKSERTYFSNVENIQVFFMPFPLSFQNWVF